MSTRDSMLKIPITTDCVMHSGRIAPTGYGTIGKDYAHRLSYEKYVGPIPKGLQIDHLCRNRACINWRHLEPVTGSENMLRSPLIKLINHSAKAASCPAKSTNKSGFKGVCLDKRSGKWRATIHPSRTTQALGYFLTAQDAALAYDRSAFEHWGELAYLNFPDEYVRRDLVRAMKRPES